MRRLAAGVWLRLQPAPFVADKSLAVVVVTHFPKGCIAGEDRQPPSAIDKTLDRVALAARPILAMTNEDDNGIRIENSGFGVEIIVRQIIELQTLSLSPARERVLPFVQETGGSIIGRCAMLTRPFDVAGPR